MNGKKVCMIVLNTLAPDPRVWKEGASLVKAGYRVTILAVKGLEQEEIKKWEGMLIWRIFNHYPYSLKIWQMIPIWLKFVFYVFSKKRERFEVCHCHDAEALPMGYLLAKRDNALLIYDVHELSFSFVPLTYIHSLKKRFVLFIYRFMVRGFERILIKKANAVITVNHSLSTIIRKLYKLKERPYVIYNARKIVNVPKNDYIRTKTGIPKTHKILFYQGMIRPDRELDRVIKILPLLDNEIVFVIAGLANSKVYLDQLHSLAHHLGVDQRFYYVGFLNYENELLEATASADIGVFLLPGTNLTYKYSLANKIFDYIMGNLPMITSDLPEMKRVIEKYHIGFTIKIEDEFSFVDIAHRLTSDEKLYRTIVRNIEKAKKDLCWENEEKGLLKAYHQLVGQER
jgi:glycosyltransferase involved in cell wall biosynthesis